RTVGKPLDRFNEDRSRILRALYLAAKLPGFRLETETRDAIIQHGNLIKQVPIELIGKIVDKVLKSNCLAKFTELLVDTGTLQYVFPELQHLVGLEQNPLYHDSDAMKHTIRVIKAVELTYPGDKVMLFTALFHDCAKGLEGVRGTNKKGQPNDL